MQNPNIAGFDYVIAKTEISASAKFNNLYEQQWYTDYRGRNVMWNFLEKDIFWKV